MLRIVPPPAGPVYRVAWGSIPFAPPPWSIAGSDGTFGNRFDDPSQVRGVPPAERFRMLYCASQPEAAFGETTAHFRADLALLARLHAIPADPDHLDDEIGVIPKDWCTQRSLGIAVLDPGLRCVDFAAAQTIQHLRSALADLAHSLGLDDVDLSTFTSRQRPFTQAAARYLYELTDELNNPSIEGIRYISRLSADWECWAFFDARIRISTIEVQDITSSDPGLQAAARLFNLRIE